MLTILFALISPAFASDATDAALESAYIQTGLKGNVERLGQYISDRTIKRSKEALFISGLYGIYRTKRIEFRIKKTQVELHPDSVQLKWSF